MLARSEQTDPAAAAISTPPRKSWLGHVRYVDRPTEQICLELHQES